MRSLPEILADCQAVMAEGALSSQLAPHLVTRFAGLMAEGLAVTGESLAGLDPDQAGRAGATAAEALQVAQAGFDLAKQAAAELAQVRRDLADAQGRCDQLRQVLEDLQRQAQALADERAADKGAG